MPRKNPKSLSPSIDLATKNPLSSIHSACEVVRNNLNQALEYLDLISICAKRGLYNVDKVLSHEGLNVVGKGKVAGKDKVVGKIDKRKFVYILISTIVSAAIKEYAFESDSIRRLVDVNLEDDFDFKGDEDLMVFVIQSLIKNSLCHQAKINIWLDSKVRCLYFQDNRKKVSEEELEIELSFCKKVMKACGGNISWEVLEGEGIRFCLKF
jgi:hypothetical protein